MATRPPRFSALDFLELAYATLGDIVVVPDPLHSGYIARLERNLRSGGITDMLTAAEVLVSIKTWVSKPIQAITIASKGMEWLAVTKARGTNTRGASNGPLEMEEIE